MADDYLQTKGRIFDIQRYSIHDGTGIRTIVFLKGCFLRCLWCCNPESQHYDIETMRVQGKDKLIGRDVTVSEVMETVRKDRPYYRRTGGGLTLSGGEMLFQREFAGALLRAARAEGISTAAESTGFAEYQHIEALLPYLNQYLLDIKHMDSAKHRRFTGVPNERILDNARRIAASGMTELSIRVPTIPGFNDSPEEIRAIAEFAGSLPGVRRIHLLPYHRLGIDKYEGLGRQYGMPDISPPSAEQMQMLQKIAETGSGLECRIGG